MYNGALDSAVEPHCSTARLLENAGRQFPAAHGKNSAVPEFESSDPKLLIADDSGPVRERMVNLLAPLVGRANIAEAVNVTGTLVQIVQMRPDIVVLDLDMPGGSGFAVLDLISGRKPAPVMIVLTNYGEPEIRSLCLRSGANYFFDKSAEFERVPEVIAMLLRQEVDIDAEG